MPRKPSARSQATEGSGTAGIASTMKEDFGFAALSWAGFAALSPKAGAAERAAAQMDMAARFLTLAAYLSRVNDGRLCGLGDVVRKALCLEEHARGDARHRLGRQVAA